MRELKEISYKYRNKTLYIGDKIGSLTIIKKAYIRLDITRPCPYIPVVCDCGVEKDINAYKSEEKNKCKSCIERSTVKRYKGINLIILKRAKIGAERRGFKFEITIEDIYNKYISQNKKCALSGLEIFFTHNSHSSKGTASVDRIDSSKGYAIDNIQIVHKHVNEMKMAHNQDYFINMCKLIAKNHE